jgi:hypothetical protein
MSGHYVPAVFRGAKRVDRNRTLAKVIRERDAMFTSAPRLTGTRAAPILRGKQNRGQG